MSINYSNYKKPNKKKVTVELICPPDHSLPGEVNNLAKYTDTRNRNYFEYIKQGGVTAFYIVRKDADQTANGKKQFTPYSYDKISASWKATAWIKDRPLFQEHLLDDQSPVMVHEGEKAVIAASKEAVLSKYKHVCWSGGSNQVNKSNYHCLKDKEVILFPDNDAAGISAMVEVAKILLEKDITQNIKIIPTEGLTESFDVADLRYHPEINITGYISKAKEFDPEDYEEQWQKIQNRHDKKNIETKIEEFLNRYIYIRSITSFYDLEIKELASKTMINDWHLHTMKGKSLANALLMSNDLIRVHSVFTHAAISPGVVEIKPGQYEAINAGLYYNTYYPADIKAEEGPVEEVLDYYKWFLGDNWTIIEQFIAYMVQYPGQKVKWAPVIVSVEGGGKGLLAKLISALLGHHNCNTQLDFSQMINQFSNILMGLQFGIINELDLSTKKSIKSASNSLKKFITDDVLTIELKQKPQIKIPFFANFMIFSNEEDCLHLTKEARRYLIIKIKHGQEAINSKLDTGFKDNILDALEKNNEKLGYLLHHFQNVEIKDPKMFHRNAPKTDDFYEMVESSKPQIHRLLDERLQSNQWPFQHNGWQEHKDNHNKHGKITSTEYYTSISWPGIVVASDLYSLLKLDPLLGKEFLTLDLVQQWLKQNCILWNNGNTTKQIVLPGNTYPRAYLIKNFKYLDGRDIKEKDQSELGQIYWDHTYHRKNLRVEGISSHKRYENKKELPSYLEKIPTEF